MQLALSQFAFIFFEIKSFLVIGAAKCGEIETCEANKTNKENLGSYIYGKIAVNIEAKIFLICAYLMVPISPIRPCTSWDGSK